MKRKNKKTGIMGGTFNPIHDAHVTMARIAYEKLNLDEVLMMPSSVPPHKQGIEIAPAYDRGQMVRLAIRGIPGLVYSDFELNREGKTYSADTMRLLKEREPDTEFYFIIGTDSLFSIETWYCPERLLPIVTTVVFSRDNRPEQEILDKMHELENRFHCHMLFLPMPDMPVSSTGIRQAFRNGQIPEHVPEPVVSYIMEKGLYR